MNDEMTHGAEEHVSFLQFVSPVFGKDVSIVAALIGDNSSVSWSISKRMELPLIGYASLLLQLAVREIQQEDKFVISQMKQLMTELKAPSSSAKLRRETLLK